MEPLIHYGLKAEKWKVRNQGCVDKMGFINQYVALVACSVFCGILSLLSVVYILIGFKLDQWFSNFLKNYATVSKQFLNGSRSP